MLNTEQIRETTKRHEQMRTARSLFDNQWTEVGDLVLPDQNRFQRIRPQGSKNTQRIFDDTAPRALPRFAAAIESMLTPTTQKWHSLRARDPNVDALPEVRRWCETVTDTLFDFRQAPRARFQANMYQAYRQIGAYGNGIIYVDHELGVGTRYDAVDLASCWWLENFSGAVDTVHREIELTARQAKQQFGTLPAGMVGRAEKQPDRPFRILHCVRPTTDDDQPISMYKRWPFLSWYLCRDTDEALDEGGYDTLPYAIGRFDQSPHESYGRGPAMLVLPTIKTLNEMMKTTLRQGQRIVDPPIMLYNDGALNSFSLRAGALNFGGLNSQGQELAKPFMSGGNLAVSFEMMNQARQDINDAFYISLFQVLVDRPAQMTAFEAALRAQEKGQLLGPAGGRLQSDMLGPIIQRELSIYMNVRGLLPPMPQALMNVGGLAGMAIEYVSPLNMAQRAPEAAGFLNWLQQITPLAQADPSVLDVLDSVEAARGLASIDGVPQKWLRDPDVIKAMGAQRAQAAQAQQLLAAAPVAASTAKDLAAAHSTVANLPQPMPAASTASSVST